MMKTDFQSLYNNNLDKLESLISLPEMRKKSMEVFNKLNLPVEKMENWKNFRLKEIHDTDFSLDLNRNDLNLSFFSQLENSNSQENIVFNNGTCSYEFQLEKYNNGVIFGSIRAAAVKYPELIAKYLNKINKNDNGFLALNSAMFSDGFFIFVPKGVIAEIPYGIFENYLSSNKNLAFLKNLIIVEDQAKLIIHHSAASEKNDNCLALNVTEIFINEKSMLEWNTLQEYKGNSNILNFDFANIKKEGKFVRNIINKESYNARNEIKVQLMGDGAFADINGSYVLRNEQSIENRVFIDHASANCDSSQLFKGILDDKANSSFTGKILVRKDSQKTNAFQSSKNILLNPESRANMNPFLEIYADDVKCSHGASIGNLDPDALFYLQSRGLSKTDATKILLMSFVLEVLEKISNEEFRNYLSEQIVQNLN